MSTRLCSDRVAEAVAALGDLASVDAVVARLAPRVGAHAAGIGIDLAVLKGTVARVTLLDGTDGLTTSRGSA